MELYRVSRIYAIIQVSSLGFGGLGFGSPFQRALGAKGTTKTKWRRTWKITWRLGLHGGRWGLYSWVTLCKVSGSHQLQAMSPEGLKELYGGMCCKMVTGSTWGLSNC